MTLARTKVESGVRQGPASYNHELLPRLYRNDNGSTDPRGSSRAHLDELNLFKSLSIVARMAACVVDATRSLRVVDAEPLGELLAVSELLAERDASAAVRDRLRRAERRSTRTTATDQKHTSAYIEAEDAAARGAPRSVKPPAQVKLLCWSNSVTSLPWCKKLADIASGEARTPTRIAAIRGRAAPALCGRRVRTQGDCLLTTTCIYLPVDTSARANDARTIRNCPRARHSAQT